MYFTRWQHIFCFCCHVVFVCLLDCHYVVIYMCVSYTFCWIFLPNMMINRSDGKEVLVDDKLLKAKEPLVVCLHCHLISFDEEKMNYHHNNYVTNNYRHLQLIEYYEQHLRYNPTSTHWSYCISVGCVAHFEWMEMYLI